jgi:hypothetical protein
MQVKVKVKVLVQKCRVAKQVQRCKGSVEVQQADVCAGQV